jgi:hypothetical protein
MVIINKLLEKAIQLDICSSSIDLEIRIKDLFIHYLEKIYKQSMLPPEQYFLSALPYIC